MELVHLKTNEGTRCGYKPHGVKTTSCLPQVNCWDCIDRQFSDFDFRFKNEIYEKEKIARVEVFHKEEKIASLKCFSAISFMPTVMDVWVRPDFRKRGIATVMMKKIMFKVGPPLQLKSEPFKETENEIEGLDSKALDRFYENLGFSHLTNPKMMLWYPTVERSLIQIKVDSEGDYYTASVVNFPEIKGTGKSYNSALGCLLLKHQKYFKIEISKACLINQEC